jgi:hypothetical protein
MRERVCEREREMWSDSTREESSQDEKDALSLESITMENTTCVLEMESPIIQAQSATTLEPTCNDPDFFNPTWMHLSIPPKYEQSPDPVFNDVNDMTQVS